MQIERRRSAPDIEYALSRVGQILAPSVSISRPPADVRFEPAVDGLAGLLTAILTEKRKKLRSWNSGMPRNLDGYKGFAPLADIFAGAVFGARIASHVRGRCNSRATERSKKGRIGQERSGSEVLENPYSVGLFSSGQVRPGPPYDISNPAGASKSLSQTDRLAREVEAAARSTLHCQIVLSKVKWRP